MADHERRSSEGTTAARWPGARGRSGGVLARIRWRLMAFNLLLVFLPVAGVLFLDTYERQLLDDQERTMVEQGRLLVAALSRGPAFDAAEATATLRALDRGSGARIRVVDAGGHLLADSSRLGPRRELDAERPPEPPADVRADALYRIAALPIRLLRAVRGGLGVEGPRYGRASAEATGDQLLGAEVRAALAGRYGAATRLSSGSQRSLTLYSALPVKDAHGAIVGAVVVSRSTWRILQKVAEVRLAVLRVFSASIAAAVVLSLIVSRTIARPLLGLRDQAERVLDGRGRLAGRFDAAGRRDEIGDLARGLERLRQRLDRRVRASDRFAADLCHELKNPLAAIRAASELLGGIRDDTRRRSLLEGIQRDVAHMETLLSGIRELGRIETDSDGDSDEVESITPDLEALASGIVESHRWRGTGRVLLRGALPGAVRGTPERIVQVLENLVDNATSLSAGEPVEIELGREGGEARVRVLDRGPGIPEAHLERVFDRFFSYRPGPRPGASRSGDHAGLGLAIARSVVERHGGRIFAENRRGGGACFEVRLPLTATPHTAARAG